MAAGDDFTPDSSSSGDDLSATLTKAQKALSLDTGRLDDSRITPPPAVDKDKPWLSAPKLEPKTPGYATTFADSKDLETYHRAIASGASEQDALKIGDNGVGSEYLGRIATPTVYGVAIPQAQLQQMFGDDYESWRKARVLVKSGDQQFLAPIVDLGPGKSAQGRGVVTDFTAPLAQALKSNGFEPVSISILRNAGPDYETDPGNWYAEQKRIRGSLPGAGPWLNSPVKGQPQSKDDTEQKPWLNAPLLSDKKFDPEKPWLSAPLSTRHPAAKQSGFDLGKFISGIWDNAKLTSARQSYGGTQAEATQTNVPDPMVEQEIASIKASPDLNGEQKAANIQALRAGQAQERATAQAKLPEEKERVTALEEQAKKTGKVEQVVGGAIPYLASGLAGPLAPFVAAQQASAEAYGEVLDTSTQRLKELHPHWSDSKVLIQAMKVATEASSASGTSMLALSVLDVPAAGPILSRIVQKVGLGAATMEVANVYSQVQKNMALKRNVDPNQDVLDGLRDLDFHLTNLVSGGAFSVGHVFAEIGKPSTLPIEERIKQAEKIQETIAKPVAEPEQKAATIEENGESVSGVEEHEEPGPIVGKEETGTPEKETSPVRPLEQAIGPKSPRWDDLTPEQKTVWTDDFKKVFDETYHKFKPFFEALGTPIDLIGRHIGIKVAGDRVSFQFNPADVAEDHYRSRRLGVKESTPDSVKTLLQHELVHSAWIDAQKIRWKESGSDEPFETFNTRDAQGIFNGVTQAITDARESGNTELANHLESALSSSTGLYTFGGTADPWNIAAELVRQLVEYRNGGRISEDIYKPVYQRLMAGIKNFYETARAHLVKLAQTLGLTGSKGLDPLRKAINETEQRLAEIDYIQSPKEDLTYSAQEIPEATSGETSGAEYQFPLISLLAPLRDVVGLAPHTEELIDRLDDFRALEGELHGKVATLTNLFKVLKRRNPGVDKEIDQIGRYVEKNGKLPAMSPEATVWLKQANNGLYREIGDRMLAGGFKVVLPDGSTRPFIGAPRGVTPMPRVFRPDVQKLLSGRLIDPVTGKFTPEVQKLYNEGVKEGYFTKPEDLEKLAKTYTLEEAQGPRLTNLERARTTKYPTFFYTYSPQAMLDRLFWQSSELARLETFGQKLGQGEDLFDKTIKKINTDKTIKGSEKERAVQAISSLADVVYGRVKRGVLARVLRGASSAALAGSPHTSSKIGLSMLFNVPAYRGLGRTLLGIFNHVFQHGNAVTELRRLGLKQDTSVNLYDDPYTVKTAQKRATNVFTGILKVAGHALAQDIGKSVTRIASKLWLEDAIRQLRADPKFLESRTKQIAEDIRRRGVDPKGFLGPDDQRLKDRFVREDVQDLQTAYRMEDYPAWSATEMGSVLFQFGHWAYNGARAITRDSIIPMAQALRSGQGTLAARYFGRLLGISLASIGASEAWREVDKLFGRQENVATLGEIIKAVNARNPEALHMITSRLAQDIVGSPVIGAFGDVTQAIYGIGRGTIDTTHFFNPFRPAGVGFLELFKSIINTSMQQGGRLSDKQKWQFSSQIVSLVRGYYDVTEIVAAKFGLNIPGHGMAEAHRADAFVKSRLDVFFDMHPEFDKRIKGGTFPGTTHTPYLQDLKEALLIGDTARAKDIIHRFHVEQKLTDKQLSQSLNTSVSSHRPIPGGAAGKAFRQWSKTALPSDELQRIMAIEKTYVETARQAGIPVKDE